MEKGIRGPKSPLSLLPQPVNQEATKLKNKQKKIEGKKESDVRMGDESTSWNGSCRSYMYEGGDFELDYINQAISRSKFTSSPISHNSLPW